MGIALDQIILKAFARKPAAYVRVSEFPAIKYTLNINSNYNGSDITYVAFI